MAATPLIEPDAYDGQSLLLTKIGRILFAVCRGDTGFLVRGAVSPGTSALKSYSATVSALVPAATATDVFTITGSATKTIYVTKVFIGGTQTTGGQVRFDLLKRSTANSAGTSSAPVAVPHDSADGAATATVLAYTANPTLGTVVANVRTTQVPLGASTTTTANAREFSFGSPTKPIVLNGITQVLAVNLAGVTVTGGSLYLTVEWYEV